MYKNIEWVKSLDAALQMSIDEHPRHPRMPFYGTQFRIRCNLMPKYRPYLCKQAFLLQGAPERDRS